MHSNMCHTENVNFCFAILKTLGVLVNIFQHVQNTNIYYVDDSGLNLSLISENTNDLDLHLTTSDSDTTCFELGKGKCTLNCLFL